MKVDKLEVFRLTCIVVVIGGTCFALINPIIGVGIASTAALASILTNP